MGAVTPTWLQRAAGRALRGTRPLFRNEHSSLRVIARLAICPSPFPNGNQVPGGAHSSLPRLSHRCPQQVIQSLRQRWPASPTGEIGAGVSGMRAHAGASRLPCLRYQRPETQKPVTTALRCWHTTLPG